MHKEVKEALRLLYEHTKVFFPLRKMANAAGVNEEQVEEVATKNGWRRKANPKKHSISNRERLADVLLHALADKVSEFKEHPHKAQYVRLMKEEGYDLVFIADGGFFWYLVKDDLQIQIDSDMAESIQGDLAVRRVELDRWTYKQPPLNLLT